MNNKKGQPQKRGISYEKKKAKDHKAKHIGGPGNPDAQKGRQKIDANFDIKLHTPLIIRGVENIIILICNFTIIGLTHLVIFKSFSGFLAKIR